MHTLPTRAERQTCFSLCHWPGRDALFLEATLSPASVCYWGTSRAGQQPVAMEGRPAAWCHGEQASSLEPWRTGQDSSLEPWRAGQQAGAMEGRPVACCQASKGLNSLEGGLLGYHRAPSLCSGKTFFWEPPNFLFWLFFLLLAPC